MVTRLDYQCPGCGSHAFEMNGKNVICAMCGANNNLEMAKARTEQAKGALPRLSYRQWDRKNRGARIEER